MANNAARPLSWSDFLKLLQDLDVWIDQASKVKQERLRRYQTLIAIGGYTAPRAKEFLNLSWNDVVEKPKTKIHQYKTNRKRQVIISDKLTYYIAKNFKAIDPVNVHEKILHKQGITYEAISTRQFNENFKKLLIRTGIDDTNASSHTLRKTFAHRVFELEGKDMKAMILVSQLLDHSDIKDTTTYLGVGDKQIEQAYYSL